MSSCLSLVIEEAQPASPNGTPYLALLMKALIAPDTDAAEPPTPPTQEAPVEKSPVTTTAESEETPLTEEKREEPSAANNVSETQEATESKDLAPAPNTNITLEVAPTGTAEEKKPLTSSSSTNPKRRRSVNSRASTVSLTGAQSTLGSPVSPLEVVFRSFAQFGEKRRSLSSSDVAPTSVLMDGSKFVKMMKDCKFVSKTFSTTDVDLTFNKTVKKGERKITFTQFKEVAVPEIVKKSSMSEEAVCEKIVETGGPQLNAHTTPAKSKSPVERTLAVNKTPPPASLELQVVKTILDGDLEAKLRSTFLAFASFGSSGATSMEGSKFAKLCKDCGLIDLKSRSKEFSMNDVDITFNKTAKKGERKITFEQFRDQSLPMMSKKRKETIEDLAGRIAKCSGPIINKSGPTSLSSSTKKTRSPPSSKSASTSEPSSPVKHRSKTSPPPSTEVASPMLAKLAAAACEEEGGAASMALMAKLANASGSPGVSASSPSQSRLSSSGTEKRTKMVSPMIYGILHDATATSQQSASPSKQYRSVEESMALIQKHREDRDKLKRERKIAEQDRRKRENAEAERIIEMKRQHQDEDRADRESKMQERLEHLRQRKEARELEFLVGERRAKEVLHRKTLNDKFEEDYSKKCELEEAERRHQLEERRQKYKEPVLVGVEDAEKMLKENEARKSRRALEVQAQLDHAEATKPVHWHGNSYLRATEEFVRNKAVSDDQKHTAMYRHAKMQEFGKLVKHIADDKGQVPLPYQHARLAALTPPPVPKNVGFSPMAAMAQGGRATAPPTIRKDPQSIKERAKMGNDFLRMAIKEKPSLPPGLKLNPLKNEEEERQKKEQDQFKKRKKQGDQFLKDLRDATGHVQPKPLQDETEYLADVRKLRHRANSIENKLAMKGVDLQGTEGLDSTMHLNGKSAEELVGDSDDVLECIKAKLQLLERIEKFEKPVGNVTKKQHERET